MVRIIRSTLFVLFLVFSLAGQTQGSKRISESKTRILFVFDASQSMYGRWNHEQKIYAAQEILSNFLDSLSLIPNVEVALRVFGDIYKVPPQVCEDSRLAVPFGENNIPKIKAELKNIVPKGTTPITYSLEQSANDFPDCDRCRNIIVLITDGIEECVGDPCEVSLKLQAKGIILKPFVIGIGEDFKAQYDCVGTYIEAITEEDFVSGLSVMITQAVHKTSAQINLIDAHNKPSTTNVPISIYDHHTHKLKHHFIHTFNAYGVPDTIYLDSRNEYDIIAHTIPEVRKDSVVIFASEHNTIALKAPVGDLVMKTNVKNKNYFPYSIIREQGKCETLNLQAFGEKETYITGYYQLEVLSLPRLIIDSVLITQNHVTDVEVPGPGILYFKKPRIGFASLFKETKSGLEWVYKFKTDKTEMESIYLLPGTYRIVYRGKFSTSTDTSKSKKFSIETDQTINIDFD